jgi:hypothetical protein
MMDSPSGYSSFGQRANSGNPNNLTSTSPLNPNASNISNFASFRLAAAAAAVAQKKEALSINNGSKKDEALAEDSKIQRPASTLKDLIQFLRRADLVSFRSHLFNLLSYFLFLLPPSLPPSIHSHTS